MGLSKFLQDVNYLYCKTGVKAIENLPIRVSKVQHSEVQRWLKRNSDIQSELSNPEVYNALLFLGKIRERFSPPIKSSELFNYLLSHASPYVPVIMTFHDLLEYEFVSDLLFPYRDIIMLTTHLSGETRDSQEVLSDLKTIQNAIVSKQMPQSYKKPKRKTQQQKKINMFSYLFKRFSNEIASAADRSGMDELANAIRSGILAKPSLLEKYIPLSTNPFVQEQAHAMVKSAMNKLGDINFVSNYNMIKERALSFADLINPEELLELYRNREQQINMEKFMGEESEDEAALPDEDVSLNPSDSTLLNPDFLSVLSLFFAIFYHSLR